MKLGKLYRKGKYKMEEFIKKLFDDNSTNFFDEMYVSSENDGRILTDKNQKNCKKQYAMEIEK